VVAVVEQLVTDEGESEEGRELSMFGSRSYMHDVETELAAAQDSPEAPAPARPRASGGRLAMPRSYALPWPRRRAARPGAVGPDDRLEFDSSNRGLC
jgi:hypothetical protein